MGRRKKPISTSILLQLRREGKTLKEISSQLAVSVPTLSRRIAELENSEGILTKYRELQGLQLSSLQFRILQAVTPEKMQNCSITELLLSFHILKKAEIAIRGTGSSRVSGIFEYLER